MTIAFSTAHVVGIADGGSTTFDSNSVVVPAGAVCFVLAASSDTTAVNLTSLVFDPGGTNVPLSQWGNTISHSAPNARTSLWLLANAAGGTANFRATWGSSQGERLLSVYVATGADANTPAGTPSETTGTNTTPITGNLATVVGNFCVQMASHLSAGGAVAYVSPTGNTRAQGVTAGTAFDGSASQDFTANGSTTVLQWTLNASVNSWASFGFVLNEPGGPPPGPVAPPQIRQGYITSRPRGYAPGLGR